MQRPSIAAQQSRSQMSPESCNIEESLELRAIWDKYRKQFAYAQDITYEQIINAVRTLVG